MKVSWIKSAVVFSLILNAAIGVAQVSVSDGGSSGTISGDGASMSESSGNAVIYKKDLQMVLNDAIDVLQGLPASDEFMELKEKLMINQEKTLTNDEAAMLIIRLASEE